MAHWACHMDTPFCLFNRDSAVRAWAAFRYPVLFSLGFGVFLISPLRFFDAKFMQLLACLFATYEALRLVAFGTYESRIGV